MQAPQHTSFWIALLVGIASGSVGPFILLRRMALVGDALSHVALPGIALVDGATDDAGAAGGVLAAVDDGCGCAAALEFVAPES